MSKLKQVVKPEEVLTADKLEEIYQEFIKDIPKEAVKKGVMEDSVELIMYGYQFAVNILNEVIGMNHWLLSIDDDRTSADTKNNNYQATVKVSLKLGNWKDGIFIPIVERYSYGSGVHSQKANAIKGAITNGFKKAAAMYGIGKKFYEGLVEDYDIDELTPKELPGKKVNKVNSSDVKPITEEDKEKTKPIEIKLLNVKTKEDLLAAKKEYDKIKDELSAGQQLYLEKIITRLTKKYDY